MTSCIKEEIILFFASTRVALSTGTAASSHAVCTAPHAHTQSASTGKWIWSGYLLNFFPLLTEFTYKINCQINTMEISEALKKVHDQEELNEKLKGKYLCSALTFLKDWTITSWELNFYDKSANNIIQVTVDDAPHIKTEGAPFKDTQIPKVNISKIRITAKKALEIGKEYYEKNYKSLEIQRIFFALHGGKKSYWAISVITKHLTIVLINIDTESGKIIKSKVHNLFDKKKTAI